MVRASGTTINAAAKRTRFLSILVMNGRGKLWETALAALEDQITTRRMA